MFKVKLAVSRPRSLFTGRQAPCAERPRAARSKHANRTGEFEPQIGYAGARREFQRRARARRAGVHRRRRGLRGSARSAARTRAPPEGRPRAHFDPGARRSISRLRRGRAQTPARAGGRLSRHGRLARLSEIAAVAAFAAQGGRRRRRRSRREAGAAAASARNHPPRRRTPDAAAAARPRRVRARRAGIDRSAGVRRLYRDALRSDLGLCAPDPETRAHGRADEAAPGVVAGGRARSARPPDRARLRDWASLDGWLLEFCVEPKLRRSARASSFSASLELVREGRIELRQEAPFAPLYLRKVERDESGPKLALVES